LYLFATKLKLFNQTESYDKIILYFCAETDKYTIAKTSDYLTAYPPVNALIKFAIQTPGSICNIE